MTDSNSRDTTVANYNDYMFKIQQDEEFNSSDLHNIVKKLRAEREKALNKRRTSRLKVKKVLKEYKLSEHLFTDVDKCLRKAESDYQSALMKEAQMDNL